MTVEDMKTGFVERIGGTIFVVNAINARRERKAYAGGACKGSDCKRSNGFAGSRCCLIANTTPKGATPSDPFWEKAG
jgi:hypothetical protein